MQIRIVKVRSPTKSNIIVALYSNDYSKKIKFTLYGNKVECHLNNYFSKSNDLTSNIWHQIYCFKYKSIDINKVNVDYYLSTSIDTIP